VSVPEIHYARSGDVSIAYQAFGEGRLDLVFAPGFVSNIELGWQVPGRGEFLRALGSFSRVIQFDKRGTGMSDPVGDSLTLEARMDDVRAVMDAAGSERAVLLGIDSGGTMSAVFAATYPERTAGLILFGTSARTLWAPDHPWGPTEQEHLRMIDRYERLWGTPELTEEILARYTPSAPTDDETLRIWSTYFRQSASPGTFAAFERMNMSIDIRDVLPAIHVPTVVVHRSGDRVVDVAAASSLAEQIRGARFVELAGSDHSPFPAGATAATELVGTAQTFLADLDPGPPPEPNRILATILFTDVVGSSAHAAELGDARWNDLLERHNAAIRSQLARHRGTEVETAGDGFFATFDGPARAIRCAQEIVEAVRGLDLEIRAGLHTGECEQRDGKIGGIAVHIAARVVAEAGPGEVLVSRTVRDLVAGSGLEFEDRGTKELKGVPGSWSLYAVTT
jgi:class 3 adenylate cyclase